MANFADNENLKQKDFRFSLKKELNKDIIQDENTNRIVTIWPELLA